MKKNGKDICETLKTIRKQVADANGIDYEPNECHHEGDCAGTCPACEAEVRYIQRHLDLRRRLGRAVALVGISAGLIGLSGCGSKKAEYNDEEDVDGRVCCSHLHDNDDDEEEPLAGEVMMPDEDDTSDTLTVGTNSDSIS